MSSALAKAKAIGEDVEQLAVDALEPLEAVGDLDDHHDAVAESLLDPALLDAEIPVIWIGIPTIERGTKIEIKTVQRWTSNGAHSIRGRWHFKGRNDGQHARLLEEGAVYALAIHESGVNSSRRLLALILIPASIVDELLRERWYGVDRHEGTVARLSWTRVLDADDAETEIFEQ